MQNCNWRRIYSLIKQDMWFSFVQKYNFRRSSFLNKLNIMIKYNERQKKLYFMGKILKIIKLKGEEQEKFDNI